MFDNSVILITGGTGSFGKKFVKMLLSEHNPKKVIGLDSYGLKLAERVPIIIPSNPENDRYMKTKKTKMGHLLDDEKSESK